MSTERFTTFFQTQERILKNIKRISSPVMQSYGLRSVHTACFLALRNNPDGLTVTGGAFTGGTVDGANDHRIVMAAAIAATACQTPVTILGAQAVQKSYPNFWEEYQRLGGDVHVL